MSKYTQLKCVNQFNTEELHRINTISDLFENEVK